ncbi:hypothetical protein RE474_04495 [Methanolobus sediminis]|uniref:Uncharacterized protein n=1 Tax=Methanolobus sediminis TaxID=3072978 RepID=A0AA51UPQ3_9EURY|nr:hypothetical protein [Methanolobus sediminis]WMW25985.1 hypothetical protein RE474_04495 [Methanolobus sediminis]
MKSAFLSLTAIVMVLFLVIPSSALDCSSNEYNVTVTDIYSDLETCDITLHGSENASGLELDISLVHSGTVLDSKTFIIDSITPDSDVTKAFRWNTDNLEDGKYTVTSTISKDGCTISENTYSFVNGRQTIPRITVDDLVPNSQGFSVMITPIDAVLVDIEYMLMDDSDVIYSGSEKKVSVSTLPLEVSKDWNVLLENNKDYSARVKVKLYSPSVTYIALTEDFTAHDDVFISDTYEDDIGASATIDGISQVPFKGSVRFSVSQVDGNDKSEIISVVEKSPVILNGDDETVETIWNERLTAGEYELLIEVIGNDGNILDVEEKIIESDYEPLVNQTNASSDQSAQQSPGFLLPVALIFITIAAIISRQKQH